MQPSNAFNPYPQPGDVLDGKYRIERMLGEGGMGAVAKATHLIRRAPVALKFMSGAVLSLPGAVERFVNEAVAASQIDSDHVVRVLDVGRLPSGAPYLVMEYLDGRDLGALLVEEGPRLAVARAVHFTVQMLRALYTAHNAGIIHRDMKPSNCFVIEKDGEPDFVKLVDFGISKVRASDDAAAGANLTRTNSALGTPLYMSPEQARSPRDVDHRTDLYSVGAILYEMLCGRTPYTSETGEFTEILFKIFTTEPPPLASMSPEVPAPLAAVVHRALSRAPDARFASALEMAEALAPFGDARSSGLFAKLRTAGGRSLLPPAPPSAAMPGAARVESAAPRRAADDGRGRRAEQARGDERRQSMGGAPPDARAAKVPTHVGVTRDSPAAGRGHPVAKIVGTIAGVLALAGAIGAFTMRSPSRDGARPEGSHVDTAHTGAAGHTVDAPSPSAPPANGSREAAGAGAQVVPGAPAEPAAPDAVVLAPLPSATPSAIASPSAGLRNAPPPRTSATPPAPVSGSAASAGALPKQLSDLKLH